MIRDKIEKTYLSRSVEASESVERYDEYAKMILADKSILAWILKYTAKEFEESSIDEIKQYIEDSAHICSVNALNKDDDITAIAGMNTESSIPKEGKVYFDVRFFTKESNPKYRKMLFDIEAQNDFKPGYDLLPRGIFYCARMISMELDTEFKTDNYNNLKKVYSIWVCTDAPEYAENTITEYSIAPRDIYGGLKMHKKYDYMSVVLICLGEEQAKNNKLLSLLHTIFISELSVDEKEDILENEYNIKMHRKIRKEIESMAGFGAMVMRRSLKKGMEQGWAIGMEKGIQEGMQKGMEKGMEKGEADERNRNLNNTISTMKKNNMSKSEIVKVIVGVYNLSEEEVLALL